VTDPRVRDAARQALRGKSACADYLDPESGEEVWTMFEPVPSTGWALGLTVHKGEYVAPPRATLRRMVAVALAVAGALLFLLALAARVERGTEGGLWAAAAAFSLLSAGVIVLTWGLARGLREPQGVAVTSRTAVERYLEHYAAALKRSERPHLVPTGLQLTALKFPDAASVTVTGYVWQRYPASVPPEVARGFLLPQRLGEEVTVQELERVRQGAEEVVVWFVVATLQQAYDPAQYPFDRRAVTVRLLPAELSANVVLTPDLAAYPLLSPKALPGVGEDVRVNNWHFRGSFFSYRMAPPAALGLAGRAERARTPELQFVIEAQRNFVGPFIAYLVPAVVAAGLTFALLLSGRELGSRADLLAGLSYVAALFFVIVLAHTALRDGVAAVGITYLEHFFILLYAMVALAVLNAFLVATRPDAWLARHGGNLVPKLAFWPVYTGVLLLSTLAVFVVG
jgi:hypothetical protein